MSMTFKTPLPAADGAKKARDTNTTTLTTEIAESIDVIQSITRNLNAPLMAALPFFPAQVAFDSSATADFRSLCCFDLQAFARRALLLH